MLLPSDDTLYAALLDRDAAFDGRAWVGVTSTGILCRLTCPARKPMRANCRFYASLAEGWRPGFAPVCAASRSAIRGTIRWSHDFWR